MTRVTYVNKHIADKIHSASELVIETSQDFTDSAYTSHEHRERIMETIEQLRQTVHVLVKTGSVQVSYWTEKRFLSVI